MSILKHLVHKAAEEDMPLKKVYFFWACKKLSHFSWFQKDFEELQQRVDSTRFELRFHATQEIPSHDISLTHSEASSLNAYLYNQDSAQVARRGLHESSPLLPKRNSKKEKEKRDSGRTDNSAGTNGIEGEDGKEKEQDYKEGQRDAKDKKKTKEEMARICIPYAFGRPDFDDIMEEIKQLHCPWKAGDKELINVLCCGPKEMTQCVFAVCNRKSDGIINDVKNCCMSLGGCAHTADALSPMPSRTITADSSSSTSVDRASLNNEPTEKGKVSFVVSDYSFFL